MGRWIAVRSIAVTAIGINPFVMGGIDGGHHRLIAVVLVGGLFARFGDLGRLGCCLDAQNNMRGSFPDGGDRAMKALKVVRAISIPSKRSATQRASVVGGDMAVKASQILGGKDAPNGVSARGGCTSVEILEQWC